MCFQMKFNMVIAVEHFSTNRTGMRSPNGMEFLMCLQHPFRLEKIHADLTLVFVLSVVCLFMVGPMTWSSKSFRAVTTFIHFTKICYWL